MAALNRKVQMIEEDLERSEERSGQAQSKLAEASQAADEAKRSVLYTVYKTMNVCIHYYTTKGLDKFSSFFQNYSDFLE